jgi:hypothetical protein
LCSAPELTPAAWEDRLTSAAEGVNYPPRTAATGPTPARVTRKSLRALQDEVVRTRKEWADDNHVAFGVWVQPETCTVRIESDLLLQSEIRALVDRYGTAICFDTTEGSAGMLLR